VLQIVDVYDALTTERSYKKAFSSSDALLTMKEEVAKGWWDPHIFSEFDQLIKSGTNLLSKSVGAPS
jgi:putative two-component system response regulator